MKQKISKRILAIIFILGLLLTIPNSVLAADGDEEDFTAGSVLLGEMQVTALTRTPVLSRPHVFIRSQTKYSGRLYRDHYNWHDRSLFASRYLWDEGLLYSAKKISFKKSLGLYQDYDLDGFATFAWPGQYQYDNTLSKVYESADELGIDSSQFNIMLELTTGADYWDMVDDTLNLIEDNPYSFKIGGKAVVGSYTIDSIPIETLETQLNDLRDRSNNGILFIPQLHFSRFYYNEVLRTNQHIQQVWKDNNNNLPASLLYDMQDYLRDYARLCDGLYLGPVSFENDYTLDNEFLDQVLYPLFASVLTESEFDGTKLFATQATVGYTSYHGSQTSFRDGTKTLRTFFDLASKYRPDLVIGTEWDELNEDTGFQPMVAKPMASQRIIKYNMSQLKGGVPTCNPDDDLTIPNLIISQRRQLSLGWKMDIELLNVPDTNQGEPYTAILELLDINDDVIFTSQTIDFNTAVLKDHTFNLPSEDFNNSQVLQSRLTINYRGITKVFSEGLPFTVLKPTICWDQTYFNTPLRNVLQPNTSSIDFVFTGEETIPNTKEYTVSADIVSPENIAIVEVVQDSLEQFAYDPQNEYLQNDLDRKTFILRWSRINNPMRIRANFSVTLDNAPSARTFARSTPNVKDTNSSAFTESFIVAMGNWAGSDYFGYADNYQRSRKISIENSEIEQAVITVDGTRIDGPNSGQAFTWNVPINEVNENGIISKVFDDGLMLALEVQSRPLNHPLPLATQNVNFSQALFTYSPNGILAVRAVTEEGKVYWSKPFAVNTEPSEEKTSISVYSDFEKEYIDLQVAEDRVPNIRYDFNTAKGNILNTSAGREFYGHLGGTMATATSFMGLENLNYSLPFPSYARSIFEGADTPAPLWDTDNGDTVIRFDGDGGNFIALPNTVIPQRAGFMLSFEIKPDEVKPYQVLFAHEGVTKGGVVLSVRDGLFEFYYIRRNPHDDSLPFFDKQSFTTNIPLYAGQWQEVILSYDGTILTLSANGQTESFPFEGVGLYLQGSGFGGRGAEVDGVIPFYKGLLRSFRVQHGEATEICADVNQDGEINTTDAQLILRNSLGLSMSGTDWQESTTTGDVNCDGNSNSIDAMLIMRYSLGLDMDGTNWCEN